VNARTNKKSLAFWAGVVVLLVAGGFLGGSLIKPMKSPSPNSLASGPSHSDQKQQAQPGADSLRWTEQVAGSRSAHRSVAGSRGTSGNSPRSSAHPHSTNFYGTFNRRTDQYREQQDRLAMPEWEKIFTPGGDLRDDVNDKGMTGSNGIPDYSDLYGGIDAEFIQETLSNGVATDMSALVSGPNLSDEVLFNGAVRPEHDLGNAYVMATIGLDEHLRLYAGVERLITDAGTYIEFEFNKNPVNLRPGAPWPIDGKREEGDLLVRMIFSNRTLQSVQLEQWHKDGFKFLDTGPGISGDSCMERRKFMYCAGLPPIQHPEEGFETWDDQGNRVDSVQADDFVEVGIDVDLLIGSHTNLTSVLFRTPEDIAMNNFNVFEPLAQRSEPSAAR